MTDLGTLYGSQSWAAGINDSGQGVGNSSADFPVAATTHAFLYSDGYMTDLGTLSTHGGANSQATGINASGQVVGSSDTTFGGQHAFLYTAGLLMADLGTLGGASSFGAGINASGQVVGYSRIAGDSVQHAFLYSGGQMIDLGTFGASNSAATGINASGRIVGYSWTPGDAFQIAFLYANGIRASLGSLGGTASAAWGINASGQIVGASYTTANAATTHAFLYTGGTMTDLNSLLPAGSGWQLSDARSINDSGQIVGWGIINGQTHAFRRDTAQPAAPPAAPAIVVTNDASFAPFISPGSLVALFGNGNVMAKGTVSGFNLPLPTSSGGTSVTMNGIACPLVYVSPAQINLQAPMGLATGTATVVVNNNGQTFSTTVQVSTAAPGVFTSDFNVKAILQDLGGALLDQNNPASPGQNVVMYFTGIGPITNNPGDGRAAPGGPLAQSTSSYSIVVNGVVAHIDYLGLTPGYAGLGQVNFQIPASTPASNTVPVVLTIAGTGSKTVQISVKGAPAAAAPSITQFSADSTSLQKGQSTTLRWAVSNATSVSIDNGIGTVGTSASVGIAPSATTTYKITATGNGLTATGTVTVTVVPSSSCTTAPNGGAPIWTSDIVQWTGDLNQGGSNWQGFTVPSQSTVTFKSVSDYQNQAAIITPDQLTNFKNGSGFSGYALFDGVSGAKTVTLAPGQYYAAVRYFGNGTDHGRFELDGVLQVPGATFVDYYLDKAVTASPGRLWQPFTIECGYRYFLDGLNSGVQMYLLDASQFANFQSGAAFTFYQAYSSAPGVVDEDQPDDYELILAPGNYYLVYLNQASNAKQAVYTMSRWK